MLLNLVVLNMSRGKIELKSCQKGKRHSFSNKLKRKVRQIEMEGVSYFLAF